MESLLLMSYFMWSWDVLVHLFPSLSQLLGLKAWSLDSAVLSSARDAKNPQVALVSHGNFEDFWRGFWCRSFLTPIESVFFLQKRLICGNVSWEIFWYGRRFHTSKKKFEFFQVVLCLVEAPFVHLLDLDLLGTWLFFGQVWKDDGWWMCVLGWFLDVFLFCLVSS